MDILVLILNIVSIGVGIIVSLVLLEFYIRFVQKKRRAGQEMMTISVRVSRENETSPLVAEQIFSTIHGIARNLSFWDRIRGVSQDQVSFEIASVERSIRFYAHFPSRLRNLIEGQVYAQYPDVEIEEVTDYAMSKTIEVSEGEALEEVSGGVESDTTALVKAERAIREKTEKEFIGVDEFKNAVGADLVLEDVDIYPIKRYPQYEDKKAKVTLDPLAAITSSLAKFNDPDEQAWIQVVIRPLEDKWRVVFTKCIRILKKGIFLNIEKLQKMYARAYCTRSNILRIVFFPLYWSFAIQGIRAGKVKISEQGKVMDEDCDGGCN
jgi:hypothetical protein